MNYKLEMSTVSSLEKIFIGGNINTTVNSFSCLNNEILSFQIAYKSVSDETNYDKRAVNFIANGPLAKFVTFKEVTYVPGDTLVLFDSDDNYECTTPGLFPDPLFDIGAAGVAVRDSSGQRAIWVYVQPTASELITAGNHTLTINAVDLNGNETVGECAVEINVVNKSLPVQTLDYTCWVYCDCIAIEHNVEMFSDEFYKIFIEYITLANKFGMNMILTPIFTPPLETAVGTERPTAQLIDIQYLNGKYAFGYDKFDKWVDICSSCGIEKFEISHILTQWDANHAPKIMATTSSGYEQIFGWDTDALGDIYKDFIREFFVSFGQHLQSKGLSGRVVYHIVDEPGVNQLPQYKVFRNILEDALGDVFIMDAMSEYDLYKEGAVKNPVPSSDNIEPFLQAEVKDLWTYYCCGQVKDVSNRFFSMPSARNRIIGVQLYKYNIAGFLHWGLNHYASNQFKKVINPYLITDGDKGYQAGDAFCLYPTKTGAVESLRMTVFNEALQDLRALQLLESIKGREYVLNLIEDGLDTPITFKSYPKGNDYLLNLRTKINNILADN